jgi:hypothetical protein
MLCSIEAIRSPTEEPALIHPANVCNCCFAARTLTGFRLSDLYRIQFCHASRNSSVSNAYGISGWSTVAVTCLRFWTCGFCPDSASHSARIMSGFCVTFCPLCASNLDRIVYNAGRPLATGSYRKNPASTQTCRTLPRVDRLPKPVTPASSSSHHSARPLTDSTASSQQPEGPIWFAARLSIRWRMWFTRPTPRPGPSQWSLWARRGAG